MKILASPAALALSLFAANVCLHPAATVRAATAAVTAWQGAPGVVGDWFAPTNWSDGVPTGGVYYNVAKIDNRGGARIASGSAQAGHLQIAEASVGSLILEGGELNVASNLYLGSDAASLGNVTLNGGLLKVQGIVVGNHLGQGRMEQSGGTFEGTMLALGSRNHFEWNSQGAPDDYGRGFYHLLGGRLKMANAIVGSAGVGHLRQEGGAASFEHRLTIGGLIGETTFSADFPETNSIPFEAAPTVDELTHDLDQAPSDYPSLIRPQSILIPPTPSEGRYEMVGGTLDARIVDIGNTGQFLHTGGAVQIDYATISPAALYTYEGGSLRIEAGLDANGAFDFAGSSAKLSAGAAILNFSAGLPNAQHARIEAGVHSLTILPTGFDPQTQLGSIASQGMVHVAGNDLVVPANESVNGWGSIGDHVIVSGVIAVTDLAPESSAIDLTSLELLAGGAVDLGQGRLTATHDRSVIRGGAFKASHIVVSGRNVSPEVPLGPDGDETEFFYPTTTPSLVRQTGGSVEVDAVQVPAGRYEIEAGTLHAQTIDVGQGNLSFPRPQETGSSFIQRGGTVVAGVVQLSPAYFYTQFRESAADRNLVRSQPAAMTNSLTLASVESRYELHGGELQAERVYVGMGPLGEAARFVQTGGELRVSQGLSVFGSNSSYAISGGSLHTRSLHVGGSSASLMADGALSIVDQDAEITVAGQLVFGVDSTFVAVPGATIHLTRPAPPVPHEFQPPTGNSVAIHGSDSDDLLGLSNLKLVFEGGADAPATIEAAGEDRGPSLAGFWQNFTLDTLVVGGVEPAALSLVDMFQNHEGDALPAALYVEHLVINAGSSLDLNGLKLYYRTASIASAEALAVGNYGVQVVPEPSAAVLSLFAASCVVRRRKSRSAVGSRHT